MQMKCQMITPTQYTYTNYISDNCLYPFFLAVSPSDIQLVYAKVCEVWFSRIIMIKSVKIEFQILDLVNMKRRDIYWQC